MIDWTSWTVCARIAGSSASGIPALTSSICAPASTWAIASATTVSKLPAAISAARALRPVGLMRSPITTNGRSKPSTTSFVGDESTVSVTRPPFRLARTSRSRTVVGVGGVEARALLLDLGVEIVAAGARLPAPLLEVRVRADQPARIAAASIASWKRSGSSHGRPLLARPGGHLRRDVAPPDHGELRHATPSTKRVSDGTSSP